MLRPYQQQAHDAALSWVRSCIEPCLIEAATGSGKSHVIAALAKSLHSISKGKHILCLAPSAELVTQNREKFLLTGDPASMFSASGGSKCLRHPVVFGTPGTVKNRITKFGANFCAVVIDEAHGITPTVMSIIDAMREQNRNLRVIGFSATPYRLRSGYIYAMDDRGRPTGEYSCRDPYFAKLVYRIQARELIDQGFLTEPVIGSINTDGYSTASMELNSRGQFDKSDIDRAYHGHGRKTAAVIADVVFQSRDRQGVMIFAATIQHAQECMASLPPGLSALITGGTKKSERDRKLRDFKARKIKYLVNVSVLTTGFDAPHVDVIALLRATESVGLLQQIIGRGLRIDPDKDDCLILDYAENLERHCPDGDIFSPQIKAFNKSQGGGIIEATCPDCNIPQQFSARPNPDEFKSDKHGYFIDLDGHRIQCDHGHMPSHFGRRCQSMLPAPGGRLLQCGYRWTYKPCPHCEAENDIAARYCVECRGELIDPNEKLRIEFKAHKRDPMRIQCDRIVSLDYAPTISRSGKECIKADYVTEYRSFSVWYVRGVPGRAEKKLLSFLNATNGAEPKTVTYRKQENGMYETLAFNQPADEDPTERGATP